MKNVLVAMMVIAGIAFLVLLLNPLMGGLHDFRTNSTVGNYSITTAGGETSKNITLAQDLFNGDIQYASVASNYSADVPLLTNYVVATNALQVSGLIASQTRTVTITYDIGVLDEATDTVVNVSPTIFMFSVIGLLLFAIAGAALAIRNR